MRLFVGLELPDSVRAELHARCVGLKDVRWVDEANLHLTLAFIGEVEADQERDLHDALSSIHFDPFDLCLSEVDCFEHRGKVKVIWAGVDGDRVALCHLQHKIMSALERFGFVPQRRKFKPHVTLSYLKPMARSRVLDYLSANNDLKTQGFNVSHFSLYQSHLKPSGAVYEVLERYS